MAIVQCVPNFSEGRDLDKIEKIVNPLRGKEGVKLLNYEADKNYNRLVVTVIGEPEKVSYSDIWDDGNMLMAELDYGNHVKAIFEVGYTNQKWYDEELTAYGLDQTITVKFPHPYIRNCPTIIKIMRTSPSIHIIITWPSY